MNFPRNYRQLTSWIIGIVFLLHLSLLKNGFVWLDHGDIESHRAIIPLTHILSIFITRFGETSFYRPLVTLVLSVEYAVFGLWAPGYHLVGIFLHLLVVLAAIYFLQAYFKLAKKQALLAGLVMGVHPFSWFTVGAIANMPDVLSTLCMLLAIQFYIEKKQRLFLLASVMAILSKETAIVVIPGLLLVWEISQRSVTKKELANLWETQRKSVIGLISIFILYFILRFLAVPEVWKLTYPPMSINEAVGTRLGAVGKTVMLLFLPLPTLISDTTQIINIFHWQSLLVLLLVIMTLIGLYLYRHHKLVIRFILFCAVLLAPGLNIIPLPRFWAPNYGYFATIIIGLLISVVWVNSTRFKPFIKYVLQTVIIGWISIACFSRFLIGFRLQNDLTLYQSEVTRQPQFREGAYYLGNYYWQREDLKQAQKYFEISLQDDSQYISYVDRSSALVNLAGIFLAQHNVAKSKELLHEVINNSHGGNSLLARYNLAAMANDEKDYNQVVGLLEGYINGWNRQEPWLLLIKAYISLKRETKAKETINLAWPYLDENVKRQLQPAITAY